MSDEPKRLIVGRRMGTRELVEAGVLPEEFMRFAEDGEGTDLVSTVVSVGENTVTFDTSRAEDEGNE